MIWKILHNTNVFNIFNKFVLQLIIIINIQSIIV